MEVPTRFVNSILKSKRRLGKRLGGISPLVLGTLAQLIEQRTFIVGLAPDILEVTHATQVTVAAEMADSKNLFPEANRPRKTSHSAYADC